MLPAAALLSALIGATQPIYSIDGIALGSTISDVTHSLGKPGSSGVNASMWRTKAGGSITVVTDVHGLITMVDVVGGPHEHRSLSLPNGEATLGETGHVNYLPPPEATVKDECGAGLIGAPCEAYTLPGDLELVVNFGFNNGMADWGLSEAILGSRDDLLLSGRIIFRAHNRRSGEKKSRRDIVGFFCCKIGKSN